MTGVRPVPRVYFGGTFDPPHCGHIGIARAARDVLGAEVALVPAADPPHKRPRVAAMHRVAMLQLAIAARRSLSVDLRELARGGTSYTVDTLRELRATLGAEVPIVWLVGADSLRRLAAWHDWRALFALAHLLVVVRPGAPADEVALADAAPDVLAEIVPRSRPPSALGQAPSGGVARLPLAAPFPQSSTAVRAAIAGGTPWHDEVPAAVAAYIGRHRLYGAGDGRARTPPL